MNLPKHKSSQAKGVSDGVRRMLVIGANGAGKTLFADSLADSLGEKACRLSALDGLYNPDSPLSLEKLMSRLLHDEMLNLLNYKLRRASGDSGLTLEPTRLDTLISLWQEVFPGNRITVDSGSFEFSRDNDSDLYSAKKLSDGERATIYHIAGVLYAPKDGVIFVNSPEMFFHPTMMLSLWSRIELLRPDCRFVYTTHDLDFASSLNHVCAVWVKAYDPAAVAWDYEVIEDASTLSEDVYKTIIGARKPVLFIEGDGIHSIDSKLYPLIFKDYTVKSLGSCNKVIEATRTFNDLNALHHMDSTGIVDRDRRDENEVAYLRNHRIMVPEVAEIENILMLEEVIKAVAEARGHNAARVFDRVRKAVINQFAGELKDQALMHTRHRVKRLMECRIDRKFANIAQLERHLDGIRDELDPRGIYDSLCLKFHSYVNSGNYRAVLKVYNRKSMIPSSNVATMCGLKNKEEYIATIIEILRTEAPGATRIRDAVKRCFGLQDN